MKWESPGEWGSHAAPLLMRLLYAARVCRPDLPTATHRGPAHLVLETARGVEFELEVPPRGRILAESAVRADSRVVGELGVRALDGTHAHTLTDEVLQNGSLLRTPRCHLPIEHGFADCSLELLLLHRELSVISHSFTEAVIEDTLYTLQVIVEVPTGLGLAELVRHGGVLLPLLESGEGLL